MHSDRFSGIEIFQGRWQHGEKVGYCYPSGLEKTLCKWYTYDPPVTKVLKQCKILKFLSLEYDVIHSARILPTFQNVILLTSARWMYSVYPADGVYNVSLSSK
jgi:hypothetical protein